MVIIYFNFSQIADALCECKPIEGEPCHFYEIHMHLTCPLPDEHNTRGRQIYDPEDSPNGFGILTRKFMPKVHISIFIIMSKFITQYQFFMKYANEINALCINQLNLSNF